MHVNVHFHLQFVLILEFCKYNVLAEMRTRTMIPFPNPNPFEILGPLLIPLITSSRSMHTWKSSNVDKEVVPQCDSSFLLIRDTI